MDSPRSIFHVTAEPEPTSSTAGGGRGALGVGRGRAGLKQALRQIHIYKSLNKPHMVSRNPPYAPKGTLRASSIAWTAEAFETTAQKAASFLFSLWKKESYIFFVPALFDNACLLLTQGKRCRRAAAKPQLHDSTCLFSNTQTSHVTGRHRGSSPTALKNKGMPPLTVRGQVTTPVASNGGEEQTQRRTSSMGRRPTEQVRPVVTAGCSLPRASHPVGQEFKIGLDFIPS